MTEQRFFPGDRVKVEYEGIVNKGHSPELEEEGVVALDREQDFFPSISTVTKIQPALPTTPGSVIRITKAGSLPVDILAMLHNDGRWRAADDTITLNLDVAREGRLEFTIIFDAGAEQ